MNDLHEVFKMYREYVREAVELGEEKISTLTEFAGENALKVEESEESE